MKHNNIIFTIGVMLILVCIAGCSSSTSTIEPSEMALKLNEMPENYEILTRSEELRSDQSSHMIDLGWQKGYATRFATPKNNTVIIQKIDIFKIDDNIEVKPTGCPDSMDELSNQNIGDWSLACKERSHGSSSSPAYLIKFKKKDVHETFVMTGQYTDYEALKQLAKKAAAKIK